MYSGGSFLQSGTYLLSDSEFAGWDDGSHDDVHYYMIHDDT